MIPLAALQEHRAALTKMGRRELTLWGHANGLGGRVDWLQFKVWLKANTGFDWDADYARGRQAMTDLKRAKRPSTNAERLKRQGAIFNHSGECGKIVIR